MRSDDTKNDKPYFVITDENNFIEIMKDPIKFIKDNLQLHGGSLFKREDYNKTLNNFNKLGTWQSINMISETNDKEKKRANLCDDRIFKDYYKLTKLYDYCTPLHWLIDICRMYT